MTHFIRSDKLPALNHRIPVGINHGTPYLAFGDDSQYEGLLTFAYVVIPKVKIVRVMRELRNLKKKFKFPDGVPIHCRVLFSGQQRDKRGLGHLTRDDPMRVIHHCITLINKYDLFVRYAYAREENWKTLWGGKNVLELFNDAGQVVEHSVATNPKGVLGMLAQACWTTSGNLNAPKAVDCEIYAAKDTTMTGFMGDKQKQAHNWISGLSTVDAPEGQWLDIRPSFEPGEYGALLDLADVAAYTFCHALHGRAIEPKFVEVAERVRWWSRAEFHLDPNRLPSDIQKNPFL